MNGSKTRPILLIAMIQEWSMLGLFECWQIPISTHGLFGFYLIAVVLRLSLVQKKVQEFMFMKTQATIAWIPLKRTSLKFKQKFCSIPCKIDAQANKDPSSNKNFARFLTRQLLEQTNLNVQTETLLNPCSSEFAANVAFFAQFPIFNPMFYVTYISPALHDFLWERVRLLYNHRESSKLPEPKLKY